MNDRTYDTDVMEIDYNDNSLRIHFLHRDPKRVKIEKINRKSA